MVKIKEVSFLTEGERLALSVCKKYKLSVSSVKHSMTTSDCNSKKTVNLKIGSKKEGWAHDSADSGVVIIGDKLRDTIDIILKETPKIKFKDIELDYTDGMIVELLADEYSNKKMCKNSIVVSVSKNELVDIDNVCAVSTNIETFSYDIPYSMYDMYKDKIINSLENDGYSLMEIVNKRYV